MVVKEIIKFYVSSTQNWFAFKSPILVEKNFLILAQTPYTVILEYV